MKKFIVGAALALMSLGANAQVTNIPLEDITSCNSSPDPRTAYGRFVYAFGQPYKLEGGAYWWKTDTMNVNAYQTKVREVFVSADPDWSFVGVVLDGRPDLIMPMIHTSIFTGRTVQYGDIWIGGNHQTIAWHQQKFTKIYCLVKNPINQVKY